MSKDNIPPFDKTLEQQIIGSMMMEPNPCVDDALERKVTKDSFFIQAHGLIFEAIVYLYKERKELPDLVILSNYLSKDNDIKRIGGEDYLVEVMSQVATTVGFKDWCNLLMNLYAYRKTINKCIEVQEICKGRSRPVDEIMLDLKSSTMEIKEIAYPPKARTTLDIVKDTHTMIIDCSKNKDKYVIPFCIYGMNEELRHAKKQLHVLSAYSGVGKTGLMLTCLLERMKHGYLDCICCAESSAEAIMSRLISIETEIPCSEFINMGKWKKDLTSKYRAAVEFFRDNHKNFFVFAKGEYEHSVDGLRNIIKTINDKSDKPLDAITIDYLQNMKPDRKYNSQVDEIKSLIIGINELSGEFNLALTVLAQLNREGSRENMKFDENNTGNNYNRPRFYNLRGGSPIENEADYITFLHRNVKKEGEDVPVMWYSDKIRGSHTIDTFIGYNTYVGKFLGKRHRYGDEDLPEQIYQ